MNINPEALRANILFQLEGLKNFQFSPLSPLFWLLMFLLFLILVQFWFVKKAFIYCSVVAIILLAMTKIEEIAADMVIAAQGTFSPMLVRMPAFIIIFFMTLMYVFMKKE